MQRAFPVVRLLSSTLLLISAVLLCYGFFKWSWMQGRDGTSSLTPYQVWIGKDANGQGFSFNMAAYDRPAYRTHGSVGGFDDVRGVDRLLVFIPGAALVLGQIAVLYAERRLAVTRPALLMAVSAVAVALALVLFPFIWQALSTSNWENYYQSLRPAGLVDESVSTLTGMYDTGEFVLVAGIGLLGALIAAGLELSLQRSHTGIPVREEIPEREVKQPS